MSEDSKSPSAVKSIPSLLEAVADLRFLLLLLCFVFYLDIWLLEANIDPLNLSLKETYKSLMSAPLFSLLLFIGSYSLLMAGFFPGLRKALGLLRLYVQSEVYLSADTEEKRRLADWSLAFICMSAYSGVLGFFFSDGEYSGLTIYVINILSSDGIAEIVFRLSVFFLWLYCFSLASNVDDQSA
jgi:hypothetical protein